MDIGGKRHRITIQTRTKSRDNVGAVVSTWEDERVIWGRVEAIRGLEFFAAQKQQTGNVTTRILVRYRNDLNVTGKRAKFQGRILDIDSVIFDPKKTQLELMCKELA